MVTFVTKNKDSGNWCKNSKVIMENEVLDLVKQETTFNGIFLGCAIKNKKNAEDKPENKYGLISLYFTGINSKNENWYSVQEQYMSVDDMNRIVNNIPFGSKVRATYSVGNTPGGRQKISKLEIIN